MRRWLLDIWSVRRSLWTSRGSSAGIVGLLGLGVGLASTMFALADPFVSKALPYPAPNQLVIVSVTRAPSARTSRLTEEDRVPTIADWHDRRELLHAVTPFRPAPYLTRVFDGSRAIPLQVATATREQLEVLGLTDVGCDRSAGAGCFVLMASTRDRYFPGAPGLVGSTLRSADGEPLMVAGVAPEGFLFPWPSPTHQVQALLVARDRGDVPVTSGPLLTRRRTDVSEKTLEAALLATLPNSAEWKVSLETLDHYMTRFSAPTAWGALAAGGLILIVCVASTANLLFSRQLHRTGELMTRRALGASRADLCRLIATDMAALTLGAVAVAGGLTWLAVAWLRTTAPLQYQILGAPHVSLRVVSFTLLVAIGAAVLSAGFSTLALRTVSAGAFAKRRTQAGRVLRFSMIALQTALALFLTITSVLLLRSFTNLFRQESGFAGSTIILSTSFRARTRNEDVRVVVEAAAEKLRRIVGVEAADAITGPPMIADVRLAGCCVVAAGTTFPIGARSVTAGFFDSIGTRLVSGRTFQPEDRNAAGVVVNAILAKQAWPDRSAVGQPIHLGSGSAGSLGVVVGVVQDLFDSRLDRAPQPAAYRLLETVRTCAECETAVDFVVRPSPSASNIAPRVASALAGSSPQLVVIQTSTAQDRLTRSVAERAFGTIAVVLFTIVAVLVCVGGLVGVVAFVTARRTRELAIRLAVGASPAHIIATLSRDTLLAAGCGVIVSLAAAGVASGLLQRLVYNVDVSLWTAGLPAAGVMIVVIACSVGLTARRALRLPLSICLRQE